jgi:hypothetical protein
MGNNLVKRLTYCVHVSHVLSRLVLLHLTFRFKRHLLVFYVLLLESKDRLIAFVPPILMFTDPSNVTLLGFDPLLFEISDHLLVIFQIFVIFHRPFL